MEHIILHKIYSEYHAVISKTVSLLFSVFVEYLCINIFDSERLSVSVVSAKMRNLYEHDIAKGWDTPKPHAGGGGEK